ncbi:ATP-dependent Clp protease ATP-binding subunit [Flavilitoribacter nigricans]|uniref:Type VI secretion system ATPase ClpV n=1 Tax=Flavilitoribacter nigricans (strain ATCC 23147 / DSM 23189 / NBRC 102662 / NCIMB 1420 / SS-2) TaxID=1122177 RepID=A0A2D0N9B0_FLAN2|nr:ATP-dependent Clp protease ATP-binding subunit [Flavilitoribacter nigricans]PHN05111.1 type VI secretion system ATPase ClpV [Flavilitoribacter nigricans DSM 23189 = NBRC 102662]
MQYPLSLPLQQAVQSAQREARKRSQAQFSSGHLLWGILQEDAGLLPFLEQINKEIFSLRSWAEFRMDTFPKTSKTEEDPPADEWVQQTLKEANTIKTKDLAPLITPLHVLKAICIPEVAFTAEQLLRFPISQEELRGMVAQKKEADQIQSTLSPKRHANTELSKALNRFCEDLTEKARQGKVDPVLGRDAELQKLMQILGKRNSPNVLLVGEPGVGKTALVGGLALEILADTVPMILKEVSIFELDVNGSLVAGAFKGEVEERLKKVLQAIKELGRAILFIDEIHTLLDEKGSVGSGAVNLLKPELARGEIILIGATTHTEYKKYIEKDFAFARRFTQLTIEEPSEEVAVEMIEGLLPKYSSYHHLHIDNAAAKQAVYLAKRYIGSKRLPVAAIEIIDLAMSAANVMNDTTEKELGKIREQLSEAQKIEDEATALRQLNRVVDAIEDKISFLLLQDHVDFEALRGFNSPAALSGEIEKTLALLSEKSTNQKEHIISDDITAAIANQSGVPLGKIKAKESEKWLNLTEVLKKRVVGQDEALEVVAKTLQRSRAGLKEDNEPIGAFFFTGPTGTGKTELAKAIAEFLFDHEEAMIRFDMSEFMQEHTVETLLGAPAGFVGHEEGGLLINKIRQKPYSVILFDEIEKAHPDVYKIFLQILEEGKLTDRLGKVGDFTKAVIIFTSNAGSEWIETAFEKGRPPTENELKEYLIGLKDEKNNKVFRREFVYRRIKIIPFAPLSTDVALKVLNIQIDRFAKLLNKQEIDLKVSEEAKEHLISIGFNKLFGARPLRDTVKEQIGTPVANLIIEGKLEKGDVLEVNFKEKLAFNVL